MLAVIQAWGNHQELHVTPEILSKAQLSEGEKVSVTVQKGQILIKPATLTHAAYEVPAKNDHLILKTLGVCGGSPRIRNTRIPVRSLVQYRNEGTSDTELLEIYPTLNQKDLEAAWNYYAQHIEEIEQEIEQENSL